MPTDRSKEETVRDAGELCDEQLEGASGGVIESVGVKYTMFSSDGTPVRSEAQSAGVLVEPVESPKKQT